MKPSTLASTETGQFSLLGAVWEAILRLLKLMTPNQLEDGLKQIINSTIRRQRVADALVGKFDAVVEMSKAEWIERETNAMIHLGLMSKEAATDIDVARIKQMADAGQFGINRYFVPVGLKRYRLLELAAKVGIKIKSSPNYDGDEIPTEAGVLECDLSQIMQSTDSAHRPFNLDYNSHLAWAKEQGGSDLTSAEEMLYLLIRHFMAFGRILFVGGWIRCRNRHGSSGRLRVYFFAGCGLVVFYCCDDVSGWGWGAVPRKFIPL